MIKTKKEDNRSYLFKARLYTNRDYTVFINCLKKKHQKFDIYVILPDDCKNVFTNKFSFID